ncbi:thioesterase II family protein [Pseudofrankia inefficax]|uniref:Thioesterase n=1 Tax=Pseudofrankia inefficax (strain DSM 45817 / CECT 9037 / DDB 130130 / EuI1c) TaxID=298654 RepID=E3JCX7_PSEI1|nr:Thioesterase [Pseudofrankia inefficax]
MPPPTRQPPPEPDRWIRGFHRAPDGARQLVCFPHAGGGASYFFAASRALANARPPVQVLAAQYPGRHDRRHEPAFERVDALADATVAALLAGGWLDPARPPALFGHSMGAVVAFEVARRLERDAGLVAAGLFVSGRRAPSTRRAERTHLLDDRGLVDELRRLSGTEGDLLDDDEIVAMILPAVRGDYRAIETYQADPSARVNAPVTALVGTDDPLTTIQEAAAWREHTTAEFGLHVLPGGHFYLNSQLSAVLDIVAGAGVAVSARRDHRV